MKQILQIICFLIVFLNISNAQQNVSAEDTDIVPIDTPLPDYPLSPTEACFDIDSVQANCTPIYINVNEHFFLNDSCTGQLATAPGEQTNLNPDNAFEVAEQLVNGANEFLHIMSNNTLGLNHQWNAAENGATVTEAQCIPFRYVLKGTRIHCSSAKQNIDTYYSEISNFIINGGFEMNVFITNVDGSANGFSSFNSNYIATEFVTGDYGGNVFNHEMGHALNLSHTFETWENCILNN